MEFKHLDKIDIFYMWFEELSDKQKLKYLFEVFGEQINEMIKDWPTELIDKEIKRLQEIKGEK